MSNITHISPMQVTSPGKSDQHNVSWLHAYEFQFPFDIHHDFAETVLNIANSSDKAKTEVPWKVINVTTDLVTKDWHD